MSRPDFEPRWRRRAEAILERHYRPKLLRLLDRRPFDSPIVTETGRWAASPGQRWSDGFWPGIFWLSWRTTGDKRLRAAAESCLEELAPRRDQADANYDLGFQYFYSFALGCRLTGDPTYRDTALAAARHLCDFETGPAGVITITYPERIARFGGPRVSTKIDVMMNLALLWWAHEETGESVFYEVARRHAERSLETLLRDDGSAWELADFDPRTGALLMHDTPQVGARGGCWTRAQAWAIHGFVLAYSQTGEAAFQDAASRAIGFWRDQVAPGALPYWDLLAPPAERDAFDASAAAIVLAGLVQAQARGIELPGRVRLIDESLEALVHSLAPDDKDGVLNGGCAYYRKREGLHGATVWGEYYFLEALARLSGAIAWP